MFKLNQSENRLDRLDKRSFGELNLQERTHLQEWLAQTPEALGEDLLIIQKEFDGFADTRERLDLLALDKEGHLVVIENKLDDSGRDVVWQTIKYVGYCSSLKKAEIVKIYQQYLDRYCNGESAVSNLCEFLEVEDLEDTALNPGNEQRMILVAANFRKEVTSTVLWLIGHGIRAKCFRVSPYSLGDGEILIDLQQIIPTPEVEDYMIGMAEKESEEKSAQSAQLRLHKMRYDFWTMTLEELRKRGVSRYENINPTKGQGLLGSTGVANCGCNLIFLKETARVEIYLNHHRAEENKWIFDRLQQKRPEIEERFGTELHWQRLDEKKACRISLSKPFPGYDRENWPERIDWLCRHIVKLEHAFAKPLTRLKKELKSRGVASVDDPPD